MLFTELSFLNVIVWLVVIHAYTLIKPRKDANNNKCQ